MKSQNNNIELWTEFKANQTTELKQKLILTYTNLVHYVIHHTKISRITLIDERDFFQFGIEGLNEAIDRFDPQYGTKFETYAIQRIRGKIIDELRKLQDKHKNNDTITDEENNYYVTLSLNSSLDEEDDSMLYEVIASDENPLPDEVADRNNIYESLEVLIQELDERDRILITLYYYENLNYKQIAEVLNITVSRVSQIHTKILNELKMRLSYYK